MDERLDYVKHEATRRDNGRSWLLAELQSIAHDYPDQIRPQLELGNFHSEEGDKPAAIACYDRAHEIGPRNFWPYYLRASIAASIQDYEACYAYLAEASEACSGHVSSEEYSNIGKLYADVKTALANEDAHGIVDELRLPNRCGRAIPNAMRVSLVKDEDDIIYAGMVSSYRSGFRYFVMGDNGSTDETFAEIRRFAQDHSDAIVYIVFDPVVEHYQAAKIMGLARLGQTILAALGIDIQWVFPMDGDEELHIAEGGKDLFALLDEATLQGIKLITYCFCNAGSFEPLEEISKLESLPGPFLANTPPGMPHVRKVAFRYAADAMIEEGNHYCFFQHLPVSQIVVGCEIGIRLKHYPVRSIAQLRKKVLNCEKSLANYKGPAYIGGHWRRDVELYRREGDNHLRNKLAVYCQLVNNRSS